MFIAPASLVYPAPLGAACKPNASKHMALRRSAYVIAVPGYKHRAPTEHIATGYIRVKPLLGKARLTL
jgi:hypothetical protein